MLGQGEVAAIREGQRFGPKGAMYDIYVQFGFCFWRLGAKALPYRLEREESPSACLFPVLWSSQPKNPTWGWKQDLGATCTQNSHAGLLGVNRATKLAREGKLEALRWLSRISSLVIEQLCCAGRRGIVQATKQTS
uniref:Uncharacterized protein n=1 Tax=Sphaerodactylus townsendi TaxID=933632 RepID=A0ACB8FY49_9SAUR